MKRKSMKEQTAQAVAIIFTIGALCIALSAMGKPAKGDTGAISANESKYQ